MADIQDSVRAGRGQQNVGAEQRFLASEGERSANARTRVAHGTGVHDDLELLQARANKLASDNPRLADAFDSSMAEPPEDRQLLLERIIDSSSQLQSSTFLPRGTRAARSVARISARLHGRDVPIGSGFLVSPTLVMTNNHVLPLASVARQSMAEFEVELDIDNRPQLPVQHPLDPGRFFITDVDLDVTVVSVRAEPGDQPGEVFGVPKLGAEVGTVVTGEELNIIGHPSGRLKEIAIRDNKLVAILDRFLQYTTDTETGSSGSPVFNNDWEVVALHHASVAKRDAEGHRLRKDGTVWKEGDGEDAVWWIANEGIRMSVILDLLAGAVLDPAQAALRDEVLRLAPRVPSARSGTSPGGLEGLPAAAMVEADGSADTVAAMLRDLDESLARARREIARLRLASDPSLPTTTRSGRS